MTDEQARQGAAAAAPAAGRTAAEQACADAKVVGSCKNRSARAAVCGAVLAEAVLEHGALEVVAVVRLYSHAQGGGIAIFQPSTGRERQTEADRLRACTAEQKQRQLLPPTYARQPRRITQTLPRLY